MTDKIDQTLADDLRRVIDAALSNEETDKAIKKRLRLRKRRTLEAASTRLS